MFLKYFRDFKNYLKLFCCSTCFFNIFVTSKEYRKIFVAVDLMFRVDSENGVGLARSPLAISERAIA